MREIEVDANGSGNGYSVPVRCLIAVIAVALVLTPMAFAQSYRGTINGTVSDSSGAVIVGAQVQVTDENTKFVSTATTNKSGLYSAPFLTPDTYDVKVNAQGFAGAVQTGVVLTATDIKQVDFRLQPAATAQAVNVTANGELLQTETASIGSVLTSNEIHNAPLIDGNIYMMSTRVAGVYSNFTQNTESTQWIPVGGGISGTAFEGLGGNQLITMNGIITTLPEGNPGGYTGYVPPAIAVQELNVQTSPMDAEIGRTYGGVENTVLKTGTQRFHGELSFLYGDTIFNANTYQRSALNQPRNDMNWSQPSFTFTGPVVIPKLYHGNQKTFFMVSYQHIQYTTSSATSFVGNVPTLKERNGDFSELSSAPGVTGNQGIIYDPTTTVPTGAPGSYAAWCSPNCTPGQRESFNQEYNEGPGGNYIPTSRFNATGVNLLKYFPQPTPGINGTTPGVGNFAPTTGLSNPSWMWMAAFSIEHEFNENNKLTVAFLPYVWNAASANEDFPYVNGYSGGPGYPQTYRKDYGGLIDYTRTISPSMVLDVRSGGFYHPFVIPRPGDNIDLSKLGFTGATLTFPHPNFPAVNATGPFAGYTSLNSGASYYAYSSLADNSVILSKSFRKHSLKTGFNFSLYRDDPQYPTSQFANNGANALTFGTVFTNSNPTSGSATNNGGDGIASLLLGYPTGGTATIVPAPAYEWIYWAGFVQDDWRLTNNLVLNLGFRWDYMSPYTERHNQLNADFDLSSPNPMNQGSACSAAQCTPLTTGVPQGYHGGLEFVSSTNRQYTQRELSDRWQPRIGAAWHIFPNTVLRGGFGIFFAPAYPAVTNTGFSSNTALVSSVNNNFTPPTCTAAQGADAYGFCNISNPYPNGYVKPTGSSLGLSTSVGQAVSFVGRSWVAPKDYIWTADLEQQLPFQMVLDVAYHGNKISGYGVAKNWNALPNCYYYGGGCPNAGNATALGASVVNPMAGYLPATSALNSAKTAQSNLYLPYPEFGAITQTVTVLPNTDQRLGWIYYNALYATLAKRASHGLEFRVAATVLHEENQIALLNAGDPVTAAFKEDNGIPNWFLVGDVVYDLPKLNVNHALGYVVNGWQWDHSLNWQAGATIGVPGGAFSTGISPVTRHRSLSHWFNTCYIPVLANVGQTYNGTVQTSPVYGPPTNCQFGEQPAWIQQPTQTLNQLNGNPMHGVRLQEIPYYDMALMKTVPLREGFNFSLRVEAHNVLNTPLLGQGPSTALTSSAFGTNSAAATVNGKIIYPQVNDPRIVRFEARLSF